MTKKAAISLPEGLQELGKEYEFAIRAELKRQGEEPLQFTIFHVEPRVNSFLIGFNIKLRSEVEINVYAEPLKNQKTLVQKSPKLEKSQTIVIWRYPFDPKLKSLPAVVNVASVQILFERLRLPMAPKSLEMLAYRPGRRAMVRGIDGKQVAYIKALHPNLVKKILLASDLVEKSKIPTPEINGWSPNGIVIFESVDGIELSHVSEHRQPPSIAIGVAFETMGSLNKINSNEISNNRLLVNNFWYFNRSVQAHPSEEVRLKSIQRKIEKTEFMNNSNFVTVHGDFHLGQIFINKSQTNKLAGIIDLDRLGLGNVYDDVAKLWANCIASKHFSTTPTESEFWQHCCFEIENNLGALRKYERQIMGTIAVQLVAQTLVGRGIQSDIAKSLIDEATAILS